MNLTKKTGGLLIAGILIGATLVTAASNGEPFNEIWDAIIGVEEDVQDLSEKVDLLEKIYALEARVAVLEECGECEQGGLGEPDYDSGWEAYDPTLHGWEIDHNLGTNDLFVYSLGRDEAGRTHQYFYGSAFPRPAYDYGIYWYATNEDIVVWRLEHDAKWNEIRVLIWMLPEP